MDLDKSQMSGLQFEWNGVGAKKIGSMMDLKNGRCGSYINGR